jgi:hypothetical protein
MKLTKREQETIINWNKADDLVSISTFDKALANKLLKAGYRPTEQRLFENNVMSYEFELSKDVLAIGLKKKYYYSEDRKMEARIRMKKAREAKNKKSSD